MKRGFVSYHKYIIVELTKNRKCCSLKKTMLLYFITFYANKENASTDTLPLGTTDQYIPIAENGETIGQQSEIPVQIGTKIELFFSRELLKRNRWFETIPTEPYTVNAIKTASEENYDGKYQGYGALYVYYSGDQKINFKKLKDNPPKK
jgi:hypothetical protein